MRRFRWFSICGLAIGIGLLCGCMSTGYRSASYYPDGKIKSAYHVYNATVWHEAIKGTLSGIADGVMDFATTPAGIALLSTVGLGGTALGVRQIGRTKEKSHNHGFKMAREALKGGAA